jgi:hypothetical protein
LSGLKETDGHVAALLNNSKKKKDSEDSEDSKDSEGVEESEGAGFARSFDGNGISL